MKCANLLLANNELGKMIDRQVDVFLEIRRLKKEYSDLDQAIANQTTLVKQEAEKFFDQIRKGGEKS